MTRRIDLSLIGLLFAVNVLVRLPLTVGFDGLYGQDAYAYFDFAQEIVEGRANTSFHWPLGYPALLAGGFALFGISAQVGQAINVITGALLAPLVYILARQVNLSAFSAFVAALLMTLCGQAVQSSIVVMSDVPALFWAVLSAVTLMHYLRTEKPIYLGFAAMLLALASITRWIYLALAVPWALVVLIEWRSQIRWRHTIIAACAVAVIFIPQILYNFGENPYSWTTWALDNAFRREIADTQGRLVYQQINGVFFASFLFDPYYLSPILLPLVILGILGLRKNTRVLILGWVFAPYVFSIGMPQQNIRFLLTSFPAAVILVGAGVDWLSRQPLRRDITYSVVTVMLMVAIAQTVTTSQSIIDTFLNTQRRHKAAVTWALSQIPTESSVYTFGVTLIMQHEPAPPKVYEIYYETPDTLASKWVRGHDDYLLLNTWEIENQWQGLTPQMVYHWLRDERGLTQLGKHGNYTLFRVNG
jgi:4-amino-4-deoxy-L-arabinose transferase-like glycosyltransferase